MGEAVFGKAKYEDWDDCVDFMEFVFSQAHAPHDFMGVLPKLYKREYFMEGTHYLAREDGRIKALVGAYPLKFEFASGDSICGRGIGAVSVHPRARSKGYMKACMNAALDDMRKDGMVFSCLGGQRQRYEYFGYTPNGSVYNFTFRDPNIRHTLGSGWKTGLSLKQVKAGDADLLDRIYAVHNAKTARLFRSRDRFFDILSSWKSEIFAVMDGGQFEDYFICRPGSGDISEINLNDLSRMAEVLGLFMNYRKERGGQDGLTVSTGPHEPGKITVLSRFAENCRQTTVYHFNILDFKKFITPFLKLRSEQRKISDGSFVLKIEGQNGGTFIVSSKNGKAEICETSMAPDLVLNHHEAMKFFFKQLAVITIPAIGQNSFLQSLLPLPLFYEGADGI